ncbi:hypothetical protein [Cellulomonas sp. A375-1]|uniref:hypothetical protein n=1 Tax=Cellulomonas sp. A375-1 TaxID=1672219 RepID=UPI000A883A72|nr:hypothetical protein [Cellulomonas sp. A375-1]
MSLPTGLPSGLPSTAPSSGARPMPVIGDVTLTAAQRVDHALDGGFVDVPVLGLQGYAQQRSGRPSHRMAIAAVLAGPAALDDLAALQTLAASGEATTFSADIVTALELQKVVVTRLAASEVAGRSGVVEIVVELAESPPLPPPAQLAGFGGLDDFGLGALGFDTDLLGDLADLAGDVAGAVEGALAAVDALSALAGLASFDFDGVLAPVQDVQRSLEDSGAQLGTALDALGGVFGS